MRQRGNQQERSAGLGTGQGESVSGMAGPPPVSVGESAEEGMGMPGEEPAMITMCCLADYVE
ncbi:hypothetical protein VM98_26065 [Streptomyces rubellomurinus subsp. indigoferus]|nr:hypothetical protein VM98_26065 [Streptomyces rubellomurinus subsp. indigoferus]